MRNRILSIQQELREPTRAMGASVIRSKKRNASRLFGESIAGAQSKKEHDKYLIVTGQLIQSGSPVAGKPVELVGLFNETGHPKSFSHYISSDTTDKKGYFKMALKHDSSGTIDIAATGLVKIKVDGNEYYLKPKPMADVTHMLSIIFPGSLKAAILKFLKVRNPAVLISVNFIGLATGQQVKLP